MKIKNIKDWSLLIVLIPTLTITISIVTYFTLKTISSIEGNHSLKGQNIAEPLAIAVLSPYERNDRHTLMTILDLAQRRFSPHITSIAIYNSDHSLKSITNFNADINFLSFKNKTFDQLTTQVITTQRYTLFRVPIFNEKNIETSLKKPTPYLVVQYDNSGLKLAKNQVYTEAFLVIFLCILLCIGFAKIVVNKVIGPIKALIEAITTLKIDHAYQIDKSVQFEELTLLKDGINELGMLLNQSQDELESSIDQATSDLRQSIEQIEIQNVELDIAKRRALEANRIKSEFLANMSHELRTPLNGVLGFTRQLLKTDVTINQHDYLKTIESSANNLLGIINDILDFSKLEAGRMTLEKIPYALRDSVDEVIQLMTATAVEKGLELSCNVNADVPDNLVGDSLRIMQVLTNLIGNAIKFTETGSVTINIAAQTQNDLAVITVNVTDTGIGIDEDKQKTLFEPFAQGDTSITRRYGGTGLGLVISQRLASEMNGNINILSTINHGSTFEFTFKNEINAIPLSEPINVEHLTNKHILIFEPFDHAKDAISRLLSSWSMNVTSYAHIEQLKELQKTNSRYDFAIINIPNKHDKNEFNTNILKPISQQCQHVFVSLYCDQLSCNDLQYKLIEKPFQRRKVANALNATFDQLLDEKQHIKQPITLEKSTPNGTANNQGLKILIVDDNDLNLKLLNILLTNLNYTVFQSSNGQQAVNISQQQKFDLILMDIQMPIMDGITACEAIKNNSINTNTPIAAVTAHASVSEKQRIMNSGFVAYLTKPVEEDLLQTLLQDLIGLNTSAHLPIDKLQQLPPENTKTVDDILDWALCIDKANGKEDLAQELLSMLVASFTETITCIESSLKNQNKETMITVIHKLHGACCYSGTVRLKDTACIIESHLKQGHSISDMEPEIHELVDIMHLIQGKSAEYLN